MLKRENLSANTERKMGADPHCAGVRCEEADCVRLAQNALECRSAVNTTMNNGCRKRRGMTSTVQYVLCFSRTPFYEDSLKRIEKT